MFGSYCGFTFLVNHGTRIILLSISVDKRWGKVFRSFRKHGGSLFYSDCRPKSGALGISRLQVFFRFPLILDWASTEQPNPSFSGILDTLTRLVPDQWPCVQRFMVSLPLHDSLV